MAENSEPIDVTINAKKLNLWATLISLAFIFAATLLFFLVNRATGAITIPGALFFLPVYILLIALHELVHGLAFRYLGGSAYRIFFDKKHLMPMCAALTPMPVTAYRWAAALPTLVLAVPPLLLGLFAGWAGTYFMGWMLLLSGIGDAAILWSIRRFPSGTMVKDHPTLPGCIIYPPEG